MARFAFIQNSFVAGELGSRLITRNELKEFQAGAIKIKNMIPYRTGGLSRRPGTRFLQDYTSEIKKLDARNTALIPFIFSTGETFCVILGVSMEGGIEIFRVLDREGSEQPLGNDTKVTNPDGGRFINNFFEVTQRNKFDLNKIQYAQSGDIIFCCHSSGEVPPFIILRKENGDFEINDYLPRYTGNTKKTMLKTPYQSNLDNQKVLKLDPSSGGASSVVITSENAFQSTIDLFEPGDVFNTIKMNSDDGTTTYVYQIESVDSASQVTCFEVTNKSPAGFSTDDWLMGQWSLSNGFPRTVQFFQQRLIWGGSPKFPDTVWASAQNNFFIMMARKLLQESTDGDSDDSGLAYFGENVNGNPFSFKPGSTEVNDIVWMASQRSLFIGTTGAEYAVVADAGEFGFLTPPTIRPQTFNGAKAVRSATFNRFILFVSRDGKRVRDFTFSEKNGSQVSNNLSVLNEDIIFHKAEEEALLQPLPSFDIDPTGQLRFESVLKTDNSNSLKVKLTDTGSNKVPQPTDFSLGIGVVTVNCTSTTKPNDLINAWNNNAPFQVTLLFKTPTLTSTADLVTANQNPVAPNNSYLQGGRSRGRYAVEGIKRLQWHESRATAWVLFSDYSFTGLTLEESSQVNAWHRHRLAGRDVRVISMAAIPDAGGYDYLWFLVEREIEGETKFYIEKMAQNFEHPDLNSIANEDIDDPFYSDSSVKQGSATSTPTTTMTGLDHLEGEEVSVLADGKHVGEKTVSSGQITLDDPASVIIAGLQFDWEVETMPIEAGAQTGTAQANPKRVDKLFLELYKSRGGSHGSDNGKFPIPYDEASLGTKTFTGRVELPFDSNNDDRYTVKLSGNAPLPFNILSLIMRGITEE